MSKKSSQVILFTDVASTDGYGKYAGTYKIATEIRNAGYTCQVIDNFSFYTLEKLKMLIDKFCGADTILVGMSCTLSEKKIGNSIQNFGRPENEFNEIMQYCKTKNTGIKTCLGGARINKFNHWDIIDYIIINKGDSAIAALLDHIVNGTQLKTIRQQPSIVVDGNDYPYTQEQFAASRIKYVPEDIIFPGEALPVEIARGCIFKCAFCRFDLIGKRVGDWTKHPNCLREELIYNYNEFGTTHYLFTDELINESQEKMSMIHQLFTKLPFRLTYSCYARLDLIWKYREQREQLLESGAISLNFGIETMNDEAGKKIGKGLGSQKTKETLQFCRELWWGKLITASNFIVGLPGESADSVRNTVEWLLSDECGLDVFGFMPLFIRDQADGRDRSRIEENPEKFGFRVAIKQPWENDNMTFVEASKLVEEINNDPRVREKSKLGDTVWIGRILNLGYSVEDIITAVFVNDFREKKYLKDQINTLTKQKKQQYFQKLLEL